MKVLYTVYNQNVALPRKAAGSCVRELPLFAGELWVGPEGLTIKFRDSRKTNNVKLSKGLWVTNVS